MVRALSNPLFKNSRLTEKQTEMLVHWFCFDYQGPQIAKALNITPRSLYDHYLRLKIRQVEDISVTRGLPLNIAKLPESSDPVWLAIRQCLIYCKNRITKKKHVKRTIHNEDENNIIETAIEIPEFYPDPCKECPIGKARETLHPYLIHEFRGFSNRRRRVTTKHFKLYYCDRMIKSACYGPGSIKERDRRFDLYVGQLLSSLRNRPLGREIPAYLN